AQPGIQPRPRLRAHADLVVTRLDRLERRIRSGAGLQPGAHRRRRRARELEERRRAEALGVGEVDAHGGRRVVIDAEAGRGAAEGVAAAGARAVGVGAAVTDRVVYEVEARAAGEHEFVAGHDEAARDLQRVLRPGADGLDPIADVGLEGAHAVLRLLEHAHARV